MEQLFSGRQLAMRGKALCLDGERLRCLQLHLTQHEHQNTEPLLSRKAQCGCGGSYDKRRRFEQRILESNGWRE